MLLKKTVGERQQWNEWVLLSKSNLNSAMDVYMTINKAKPIWPSAVVTKYNCGVSFHFQTLIISGTGCLSRR